MIQRKLYAEEREVRFSAFDSTPCASGLQYICRVCRRIFLSKRPAALMKGYRCDSCYGDYRQVKFLLTPMEAARD